MHCTPRRPDGKRWIAYCTQTLRDIQRMMHNISRSHVEDNTSKKTQNITRLPPVVYDFRAADTISHSRVKAKCVPLYDTTPAQVISLSVIMPGCSPGPSEWHYSKLDMNSSKIDRIKNSIAMPGCSPGPSLQQMYCNQSKPS